MTRRIRPPSRLNAGTLAYRLREIEVRAESDAQCALEQAVGRFGKGRIHQRRTGGITGQSGLQITLQLEPGLQGVAQVLEINRRGDALLRRLLERMQIAAYVDPGNYRAFLGEQTRHADDAEIPPAISGHEQHHVARFCAAAIDTDRTEASIVEYVRGRRRRLGAVGSSGASQGQNHDAGNGGAHLLNTLLTPPEISEVTS